MTTLAFLYGFGIIGLVFLCGLHQVVTVPLQPQFSQFHDTYNYEKQQNPINFQLEFPNITFNIEDHDNEYYNESDVAVHNFENSVNLNNEFNNGTVLQKETGRNDTHSENLQVRNDEMSRIQLINNSNFVWDKEDLSPKRKIVSHKDGKDANTNDWYQEGELSKSTHMQLSDDSSDLLDINEKLKKQMQSQKMNVMGDMKYEARNESFAQNHQVSSRFSKNKEYVKDDLARSENFHQGKKYDRSKNIHNMSLKERKWHSENITKEGSEKYTRDEVNGIEKLRRKCLDHLKQENQYTGEGVKILYQKNQKNRKSSFYKTRINRKPLELVYLKDFTEDCKDFLIEESKSLNAIGQTRTEYLDDDNIDHYYSPKLQKSTQPDSITVDGAATSLEHQNGELYTNTGVTEPKNIEATSESTPINKIQGDNNEDLKHVQLEYGLIQAVFAKFHNVADNRDAKGGNCTENEKYEYKPPLQKIQESESNGNSKRPSQKKVPDNIKDKSIDCDDDCEKAFRGPFGIGITTDPTMDIPTATDSKFLNLKKTGNDSNGTTKIFSKTLIEVTGQPTDNGRENTNAESSDRRTVFGSRPY